MSLKSRREARRKARANEAEPSVVEPSSVEAPVKLLNARHAGHEVRQYLIHAEPPISATVAAKTTPTGVVVTVDMHGAHIPDKDHGNIIFIGLKFGFKVEWV